MGAQMLPENLYFTLNDAANELNCSVGKLFHLAANGYISLCTKVYSAPLKINEINRDWGCDLLVREKNIIDKINDEIILKEEKHENTDSELITVKVKDDFITRYSRLQIVHDCYIAKNDKSLVDYSTYIYGVYGLLEITERDIFINENELSLGETVGIRNFNIPIDSNQGSIDGFFGFFGSEFDSSWRSDTIDSDDYRLKGSGLSNSLDYLYGNIEVNIKNIYVTSCEINRLKGIVKTADNKNHESTSKMYKLPEFCKSLVCMATGIAYGDIDSISSGRLKSDIEKAAAKQGIEFPDIYHSTLAKYIGRSKK